MRLTDRVRLVGSGAFGFGLTASTDCHVYAVDGGSEWALIDCGAGAGLPELLAIARQDGLDAGPAAAPAGHPQAL